MNQAYKVIHAIEKQDLETVILLLKEYKADSILVERLEKELCRKVSCTYC